MKEISINGWNLFEDPQNLEGHWVDGEEVGRHLGYQNPSVSIRGLYNRNKDAFIEGEDSVRIKLIRTDGKQYQTRVFSEKGVLKLIQYSSQKIAKKIMDDVFKVFIAAKNNSIQVASQQPRQISGPQIAADLIESNLRIAELIQVPKSFTLIETTKMIERETGLDYSEIINNSPLLDAIPDSEEYLEPSEIGARLGISGKHLNSFLAELGWQSRNGKNWQPSDYCLKEKYCLRHNWKKGNKSGYNWKWSFEMVNNKWNELNDHEAEQ